MNVIELINSSAVASYLKTLGYRFSALQKAWIIFQSDKIDLVEKEKMYLQLINESDDEDISKYSEFALTNSLHEFLENYVRIEKYLLKKYETPEAGDRYCVSFKSYESFQDYHFNWDNANQDIYFSSILKEKCDERFCCFEKTNKECDTITIYRYGTNRSKVFGLGELFENPDDAMIFGAFSEMNFNLPHPFKTGDLVWDCRAINKSYDYSLPMVLDTINNYNEPGRYPYENRRTFPYLSELKGYFYTISPVDNRIVHDPLQNYMNLTYYTGELVGPQRILYLYQKVLKGEIDLNLFNLACSKMTRLFNIKNGYDKEYDMEHLMEELLYTEEERDVDER